MNDQDFLKLLIAGAISAGMTPQDAILTAAETMALYDAMYQDASNDD